MRDLIGLEIFVRETVISSKTVDHFTPKQIEGSSRSVSFSNHNTEKVTQDV